MTPSASDMKSRLSVARDRAKADYGSRFDVVTAPYARLFRARIRETGRAPEHVAAHIVSIVEAAEPGRFDGLAVLAALAEVLDAV